MSNISEKLLSIQIALKAPKSQRNTFGNYNYRNSEDILEAVKPLCELNKTVLTLSDQIINVGELYYVEATALLECIEDNSTKIVKASAREADSQKGMNVAQITGSASSYARKYALNGLFNIDDTKDDDFTNKHGKDTSSSPKKKPYRPKESPKDVGKLYEEVVQLKLSNEDIVKWQKYYNVNSLFDLDAEQLQFIIDRFASRLSKQEEERFDPPPLDNSLPFEREGYKKRWLDEDSIKIS